jgi:hypothetical protein
VRRRARGRRPHASISPAVFLCSSAPVTHTTYSCAGTESGRAALRGVGWKRDSTPAPMLRTRPETRSSSAIEVLAANSEIASTTSTVRASGLRSSDIRRALGSAR